MKSQLSVLLLFTSTMLLATPAHIDPIKIKSGVLKVIDGTDFVNMRQIFYVAHQLFLFLKDGKVVILNPETRKKEVLQLHFAGEVCSLEKLLEFERKGIDIEPSFDEAMDIVMTISDAQLEAARGVKKYMMQLLNQWSIQRDKPHSQLLQWGAAKEGTEQELFKRHVNTVEKLYDFCEDLRTFLCDLMETCEKSRKEFEKQLEQLAHHKQSNG
jgi:hypothetical protein